MSSAIKIDTLLRMRCRLPVPESTKLMTRHTYGLYKFGKIDQIKVNIIDLMIQIVIQV